MPAFNTTQCYKQHAHTTHLQTVIITYNAHIYRNKVNVCSNGILSYNPLLKSISCTSLHRKLYNDKKKKLFCPAYTRSTHILTNLQNKYTHFFYISIITGFMIISTIHTHTFIHPNTIYIYIDPCYQTSFVQERKIFENCKGC